MELELETSVDPVVWDFLDFFELLVLLAWFRPPLFLETVFFPVYLIAMADRRGVGGTVGDFDEGGEHFKQII